MKTLSLSAAFLAALILGCGCHRDNTPPEVTTTLPSTPSSSPVVTTPSVPRKDAVVYIVNPQATGDQDPLKPRTITLLHPDSPARETVEALLTASGSPLAPGTALRGITIDSGLATLDFSQNPVSDTNGEGHQSDALTALSRTLGQFSEIRQYQIEVKGQVVKSFGEFTTDGPIDVIRPAQKAAP